MSLTREERVTILLTTFLDYLPDPATSSGQIARMASGGPAADDVAPCTLCLGRGRVRGSGACLLCPSRIRYQPPTLAVEHRCQPCPICEGSGWRGRRRGEEPHDVMTGMSLTELSLAREAPTLKSAAGGKAPSGGDRLERARLSRDRSGSYRELERALELLRHRRPRYHDLAWHVLVCGEPWKLNRNAERTLERAVLWLASEMRHHRVPKWALAESEETRDAKKRSLWWGRTRGHDKQRAKRNQEIRAAIERGEKISAVARDYGLSREHVHRILRDSG